MARPEIAFELRNAISKVIKTKHRLRKSGIELKINSDVRSISVEIVPLNIEANEPLLLILFTEQKHAEIYSMNTSSGGKGASLAKDRRIKKLEQELAEAHADALAIAQEQEAFTEELQSSNEEVVSSNEELQTVNEELETSKEEIESANEELTTTNQELQTRNDLLNESYEYSQAITATINEAMIVLDKNLRIKSANKSFYRIFGVKEEDTEGMFLFDLGNKQWDIPSLREFLQEIVPNNSHFHDFEVAHNFPQIGEKIMLLNASRIIQKRHGEELILLTINDVTEVRAKVTALQNKEKEILSIQLNAEQSLRKTIEESERRYNTMLMQSPFAFAVLKGKDMVVTMANDSVKQMWGKGKKIEGKPLIEILPELKDQEFPALLKKVYTTGIPYKANEALAKVKRNGKMEDVYFNFVYQPYLATDDTILGVTIIAIEVTNEVIAKQKIKDSQQQLQNIFMQAPFALNIYEGKELVISLANKLFCEIIGKTESEILGKKLFDAFPETATQGLDKILSDVFSTGIPFKGNEFPVHFLKHGNEFKGYFDFIYQPIFDYNKNVSGVINVAIDVTDKVLAGKIIEESERKFKQLAELMPQKVWTADAKGNKNYFNKTLLDYTGMSFEELKGERWKKIIHPDDWEQDEKKWKESVSTGKKYQSESRFLNKDGKYMWHLTLAVPLKDEQDNIILWIGSKTEIDEQKEAKSKAEAAKLAAEEAMQAKQQFLSNMSHEIRTPLNSILGFTNVLLKTELGTEQKEFLQAIKTSGKSLNVLINDILDLAKVDAGKMTFEIRPFEIRASLRSIIQSFKLKIDEKNLELVKEYDSKIPLMLLGDSVRLNQIIINLISNAIKFTLKGKIILSVKLLSEGEENVTIEFAVTDTGIGIAANKIDSIFKLFEQAVTGTANFYGGTGLGLAIVKQLIEAQGGSISVKSKLGEGSTFSFILPFGKTNRKSEEEIEILKPDPEIKNLRVLVAEDVALNQLLIKIILSDFGFEYEIVSNGKIAIEKLEANDYDIILMDLQMPEMNGFEASAYIRETMKMQIPIIALTADVTTIDVSKSKEFGIDDYISKPINENLLYRKIVELVKEKQ